MKKASLITAVSKYINIFFCILFSALLSRILTPNDYGIVAIVTVFTSFFIVLSNCGLGIAVIQNKDFTQDDIDSLFSFSCWFGLGLMIVFIALAYPVSIFYKNTVYIPICIILSSSIFFNTINAVPDGILRREKKFLLIGIRLIVVSVLTYGVTIVLALLNFKYYALVIQSVTSSILIFLWNLKNASVHFRLKINWSVLKKIRGYSGYNFLFNFVNYFARNLDKLLLGKSLGNEELAQYNKAYHFMLYPVQNLTNIITPVLHPILSDYQGNRPFIYKQYMKVVKLLSLIGIFITAVCFCCSREIILLLYGSQWNSAVNCFTYMSFGIWAQMITGTSGSLFNALGDTKRCFLSCCITTAITIFFICIGISLRKIEVLSFTVSVSYNLNFIISMFMLIHISMGESFLRFLKALVPDISILMVLFCAGIACNSILQVKTLFLSLCIKMSVLVLIYIILLAVTKQYVFYYPIFPRFIKEKFRLKKGPVEK
ncbi:lipopolysaccharide biosynthesis protein [Treponema sp.]|uniref:lipopolysaccharide biosynthesis protein n=1 Tax=Treponema sp. TaxID=166 RepID=UPI003EFF2015